MQLLQTGFPEVCFGIFEKHAKRNKRENDEAYDKFELSLFIDLLLLFEVVVLGFLMQVRVPIGAESNYSLSFFQLRHFQTRLFI